MANPRQRRKAKSSTHKPVSHSKRAKRLQKKMPTIRGPKALQDAWDRSKTLQQNYLALGLQHDLNPVSSGGSEVRLNCIIDGANTSQTSSSTIGGVQSAVSEAATSTCTPPKGFGRIIRDSSGNIVRVELPSDGEEGQASKRELMIDPPIALTKSELRMWTQDRAESQKGANSGRIASTLVQDLENLATSAIVRERHTSLGERSYLERLVEKHGDDFGNMARDRRLNPAQRTANELRRAIVKAGGYRALCKGTVMEVAG